MNQKQSYQKGSVRRKGNRYYYRFRMKEPDGTMKMREFPGTESKRETQAMLEKALKDYNETGKVFDPGEITVNQLMDEWYAAEIEPSNKASTTRDSYQNVMKHIRVHPIGSLLLKEVTVDALQSYVDEKYYGEYDDEGNEIKHAYSESTMKEEFVVLNGIFKFAVYPKEYLKSSPMTFVKKRKKSQPANLFASEEADMEIITHEEFLAIEQFLQKYTNSYGDHYRYLLLPVQISYYTGLRAGELAGLCWEDIDLKNRRLIVRRSMYYDTGNKCWELKVPKSSKQRVVDFGETLAEILSNAKAEQVADQKRCGGFYHQQYCQMQKIKGRMHYIIYTDLHAENGIIGSRVAHGRLKKDADPAQKLIPLDFACCKDGGELLTTQTLKNCNKLIQKNLNTIPFHMHGLRHTYGSNMVASGANFKDVQMLMGHSDIGITLNTYAHVTETSRKSAVDLLEAALSR